MNKQDMADRFSSDVDNLLSELGVTDQEPVSSEYDEMLNVAHLLTSTDFSSQSGVRQSLRRRLLNRDQKPALTSVDIPGPWGMVKNLFKSGRQQDYASIRPRPRFNNGLLLASLTAVVVVIATVTLATPLGGQVKQQIVTLAAQFWPGQADQTIISNRPVSLTNKWQYRGEGGISSSPIVSEGRLYVGSNAGFLYALDMQTGQEIWRFQSEGRIEGTVAVANQIVFAANDAGYIYAIEATSGQEVWHFQSNGPISAAPVVAEATSVAKATVYVGSGDGYLYALDVQSGQEQWRANVGSIARSKPVVVDNTLYVGSQDWHLYALDVETGQEKWRFKTADWILSSPLVVDGMVYVGSNDRFFYALEAATGQEKWRFFAGADVVSSPAIAQEVVYFGSYDGHLYALDIQTGQEVWRFKSGKVVQSSPVVMLGSLYFGSGDGLYVVDAQNGHLRGRFEGDSQINSSPVAVKRVDTGEQYIYFVSGKGTLYATQSIPLIAEQAAEITATLIVPPTYEALGYQFTPRGWFGSNSDNLIRFKGKLVNGTEQALNGFRVQADNGNLSFLSDLSGSFGEDGEWEIVVPDVDEGGWWWLTVVHESCSADGLGFDPQCQEITPLSESIKVEIDYPDQTTINADWVCHRECSK